MSKVTHAIRYWTKWITKNGILQADDRVLEYYVEHSYIDAAHFNKTMLIKDCASEIRNAKARFENLLAEAISNIDLYEIEVATSRVERRYPHLTEENVM
jgi:hypothetical protein